MRPLIYLSVQPSVSRSPHIGFEAVRPYIGFEAETTQDDEEGAREEIELAPPARGARVQGGEERGSQEQAELQGPCLCLEGWNGRYDKESRSTWFGPCLVQTKICKKNSYFSSHRILRRIHKTLNINKK